MSGPMDAERPQAWPRPTLWQLFSLSLSAVLLLWMPFALLRQLDAFVAFKTGLELVQDIALASVIIGWVCFGLAAVGAGLRQLASRFRPTQSGADALAWTAVLLPCTWVCLWQLGGTGWTWFKLNSGTAFNVTPHVRTAVAGLLLTLLAWLVWRGALRVVATQWLRCLQSLRGLAITTLLVAVLLLVWHPPRVIMEGPPPAPPSAGLPAIRDIFLITIDTLAEADAQVCGSGPTLMPKLREFAAKATCFSRAYSTANFTTPSTISLETGALPWHHWGVQIVAKAAEPLQGPSLSHGLRDAGYRTLSFSANILASPRHHGTDLGYDEQRISETTSLGSQPRVLLTRFPDSTLPFWLSSLVPFLDTVDVYLHGSEHPYPPELTYTPALAAIRQSPSTFAWIHTLPPHDPFLPPASTRGRLLPTNELTRWSQQMGMTAFSEQQEGVVRQHRLRYRESIMGADEALGRLLDQLRTEGRLDSALVIISSDHGESFAHGYLGHAGDILSDDVLRVPLVIKLPGQREPRTVDTPVSLVDVAATIADLGGAPPLKQQDGRSLRQALQGAPLPVQPVFAMAMERQSRFAPIRRGRYAVIDGPLKLVLDRGQGTAQLFDLMRDPGELEDLAAARPHDRDRLRQLLEARLAMAEAHRQTLFASP